jgi:hypothetical protein
MICLGVMHMFEDRAKTNFQVRISIFTTSQLLGYDNLFSQQILMDNLL